MPSHCRCNVITEGDDGRKWVCLQNHPSVDHEEQ